MTKYLVRIGEDWFLLPPHTTERVAEQVEELLSDMTPVARDGEGFTVNICGDWPRVSVKLARAEEVRVRRRPWWWCALRELLLWR